MIDFCIASKEIINVLEEVCSMLDMQHAIDIHFIPGNCIMSQVLISITPMLEQKLNIVIPEKEYIFFDSKTKKQLTIGEATNKLLKII